MTTKLKAKKEAEKVKTGEEYILRSGSHTQVKNGIRTKFECGDLIVPTASELERFPLKFMSLSEYDEFLLSEERRRKADRALRLAQFPPTVLKIKNRESAALKRQKKLNKSRRRSESRILL